MCNGKLPVTNIPTGGNWVPVPTMPADQAPTGGKVNVENAVIRYVSVRPDGSALMELAIGDTTCTARALPKVVREQAVILQQDHAITLYGVMEEEEREDGIRIPVIWITVVSLSHSDFYNDDVDGAH